MLANNPEEATEQAEEFLKERPLAEFFDEIAIPALIRAQVDSDDGALLPKRRQMIKEGMRAMLEDLSDEETGDPPSGSASAGTSMKRKPAACASADSAPLPAACRCP